MAQSNSVQNQIIIGYTTGVFDLFHVGHLKLLQKAKSMCDKLIVVVTVDKLVKYKFKKAVIPFEERIDIVANIKAVDLAVPQKNLDKFKAWDRYKYNLLFVGDDWYQNEKWNNIEKEFNSVNVKIIYFPYTEGTSSTLINEILLEQRNVKKKKK